MSFYSGATFSVFYFEGQFHAVQQETASAINLSTDFRIVQAASQTLVVVEFSSQTHTIAFEQPTSANEYRVQGIILFHAWECEQMLLNIGPDGFRNLH